MVGALELKERPGGLEAPEISLSSPFWQRRGHEKYL